MNSKYKPLSFGEGLFFLQSIIKSLYVFFIVMTVGCKKDWMDAKPDKALVVPKSIKDFQAMLDNNILFNGGDCFLDEIGANDFYITDDTYNSFNSAVQSVQRNAYAWAPDFDGNEVTSLSDWNTQYQRIFYANIVLEGIQSITPKDVSEQTAWNNVKGAALFFRAYSHYSIARGYCKPYVKASATLDPGIPVRLESDVNIPSVRGTVQQTYNAIIQDINTALNILPVPSPSVNNLYRMRPSKAAANALLARVYLAMSNYDSAFKYADQCLQLYSTLINYNTLSTTSASPFGTLVLNNDEILFSMTASSPTNLFSTTQNFLIVDSTLYASYSASDRRKQLFFKNVSITPAPVPTRYTIKNGYAGATRFTGLATDEVYLIRAECYARGINGNPGNKDAAMADLNTLLSKRVTPFVNDSAPTAAEALQKILRERRKELCFRGIRWSDLRRLNQEQQFAVTLTKIVKGQQLTLLPNSPLYVLPIPSDVILLSGMPQNPR